MPSKDSNGSGIYALALPLLLSRRHVNKEHFEEFSSLLDILVVKTQGSEYNNHAMLLMNSESSGDRYLSLTLYFSCDIFHKLP